MQEKELSNVFCLSPKTGQSKQNNLCAAIQSKQILEELKILTEDFYNGVVSLEENCIILIFSNGQKFCLTVSERAA